jgi:hypothetical protein
MRNSYEKLPTTAPTTKRSASSIRSTRPELYGGGHSSEPEPIILCTICGLLVVGVLAICGKLALAKDVVRLQLTVNAEQARAILAGVAQEDLWRLTSLIQFHLMFPPLYGLLLRRRVRCLVQFSPLQVTLVGAATLGAALDVVANALLFSALPGERDLMEAPDWLLASAGAAAICKWAVLVPTLLLLMPFSPMMARIGPMTIPFAQYSRYDRFNRERDGASASSRKVQ